MILNLVENLILFISVSNSFSFLFKMFEFNNVFIKSKEFNLSDDTSDLTSIELLDAIF